MASCKLDRSQRKSLTIIESVDARNFLSCIEENISGAADFQILITLAKIVAPCRPDLAGSMVMSCSL